MEARAMVSSPGCDWAAMLVNACRRAGWDRNGRPGAALPHRRGGLVTQARLD